ncbi:MAG: hypothetical protein IPJ14_07855 [Kineosporiaceae bacterium]|nr:hypothetical protein [Kineosporiaceae bacterium]MBK7622566.1 hypothetical protein [Kineosporiaceae bacterium]
MSAEHPSERLRRLAAAAELPTAVVTAWHDLPPEPDEGQLWRARWEDQVEIVLVTAATPGSVQVVPVTLDVGYEDDETLVVPPGSGPLGVPFLIWRGLPRNLPRRVLDRYLGSPREGLRTTAELAAAPATGGATTGTAITSAADPRSEYRARLEDSLDRLAAASWAPRGTGQLGPLLQAAGQTPATLIDLLGITPQQALALLRGQVPLAPPQADLVAQATGRSVAELLAANPSLPPELVARLDQPRRRRQVQQLAERRGVTETEAWRQAGYETLALAARQTGDRESRAWEERLDRYFHVVLDA